MDMRRLSFLGLLIGLVILIGSCKSDPIKSTMPSSFEYDLTAPDTVAVLPEMLHEASGLAYDYVNDRLLTHDDERGVYFSLLRPKIKVRNKVNIADDDDHEGIAFKDDVVYIINSSGKVKNIHQTTRMRQTISSSLSEENNIEGICYHLALDKFLLAGKGKSLYNDAGAKTIYSLNSDLMPTSLAEFHSIYPNDLIVFMNGKSEADLSKQVKERLNAFAPSGIDVHPITSEIYIISSTAKLLVILTEDKKLKDVVFIENPELPKPEGICFGENAVLYIASEGVKGPSTILRFPPKL